MDFWTVVDRRHSVRDFSTAPVAHDSLERVLHAASMAASARNAQPWRFHVTTGATRGALGELIAQTTVHLSEYMEMLGPERYEETAKWYSTLGDAPVVVAVSMDSDTEEIDETNALLSVGGAIAQLLLAATAEGLAACNITFSVWVRDEIEELLGISGERTVVAVVALGHPGEVPDMFPPRRDDTIEWLE